MSKESLQVIAKDAATLYANHRMYASSTMSEASVPRMVILELTDFDKEVGITEPYDHYIDPQARYDSNIQVATEFAANNAEQLHDLALEEDKSH